jgi:hypothetical protein
MLGKSKRMSVDWQNASDRLNRFRTLDPQLNYELTKLSKAESRDDKLAFKLEEGRTYGMRQQYYDNKLKRDLARSLRHTDITEEHW